MAVAAWRDFHDLTWNDAVAFAGLGALLGGVLIALVMARFDPKEVGDPEAIVLCSLVGTLWMGGLILEANGRLPARQVKLWPAEVVDMERTSRRGFSSYRLWLEGSRWSTTWTVPRSLYRELDIGDVACLREARGALGLTWREVVLCDRPLPQAGWT